LANIRFVAGYRRRHATTARSRVVRNVVSNPYVAATSGAATATDWHRAGTDIEAGRAKVDLLDANETSWAFSRGPTWLIPGSRKSTALAVLGAESCGKLWQGPVRDRAEDRPLASKPESEHQKPHPQNTRRAAD
jgi:hypothetical protein